MVSYTRLGINTNAFAKEQSPSLCYVCRYGRINNHIFSSIHKKYNPVNQWLRLAQQWFYNNEFYWNRSKTILIGKLSLHKKGELDRAFTTQKADHTTTAILCITEQWFLLHVQAPLFVHAKFYTSKVWTKQG